MAIVKLLVAEFLLVLAFNHTFLASSSFVGLDKICARQNGTVCYHRAPEECSFGGPGLTSRRQESAINHEALISATILVSQSDPSRHKRYFKLEWTQASGSLAGTVFVRVSQLVEGHVLQEQVICLSNLGTEETVKKEMSGPDFESKGPRHSTLVLLGENVTSSLVEISMSNAYSEIMVAVPKYSIHSFILQAVSITVQDQTAYISLSPPNRRQIGPHHYAVYTLTLMCYTYIEGSRYPHNENNSRLNILSSVLASTNCSNSHEEIFIKYDASYTRPVMFGMTKAAYELVIDVKLVSVASDSDTSGISLRTLKFGYSALAYKKVQSATTAASINTGKTLVFNVKQISHGPNDNTSDSQLGQVGTLSASSSEEKNQSATTDISQVIWGSSAAFVALVLVVASLFLIKRIREKRSNNTVRQIATAETYNVTEASKGKRKLHYIAIDNQPALSSVKKPKLCPDCCTNRCSDISLSDNVSNLLISTSQLSHESLHKIYSAKNSYQSHDNFTSSTFNHEPQQNYLKIELILNNVSSRKDGFHDCKYQILLNGKEPKKQEDSDIKCDSTNFSCIQTCTNSSTDVQSRLLDNPRSVNKLPGFSNKNRGYYFTSNLSSMSNSMLSLTELNSQRKEVKLLTKEVDCEDFRVIEPELFVGSFNPETMISECMKINEASEDLIRNFTDVSRSCEIRAEDECLSICGSIAC